jgi:DNA-binding winged helix-turn-helix (wHTH) protein
VITLLINEKPIRLDYRQHRVWVEDQEVELTAREMFLLERLARQPNEIVSLVEMVKATHDLTTDSQEAGQLLCPLIRTLRRKLEVHLGKVPCIKNVRSRGYLLIASPQALGDAPHKRRKGQGRRARWLVFVVLHCTLTLNSVRQCYRQRFGIETSYRCMRQVRAWTTSRNAALRFMLMGLGFIRVNLWVELRYRFCQLKQKHGPRKIVLKRFQLQRLICFLNHAIEKVYALVLSIQADVSPLGV